MPAKWQQWMPLDIEAFKSSPVVQAMRPAARSGYLYLLTAMWQSEDCTLSADDEDLMIASGMGSEWDEHKRLILKKFIVIGSRVQNSTLLTKWLEAKRVFEARQNAAKNTTAHGHRSVTARSPLGDRVGHPTVTEGIAPRSADTTTETVTRTKTKKQKQKQKPSVADAPGAEKPATSSHHEACKRLIHADWARHHPGEPLAPWDGSEAKQLAALLAANPGLSEQGFARLLDHRARSEVNLSQRPREWLGKLRDFTKGPLDRYGKPLEGVNGKSQATRSPGLDRAARNKAASDAAAIALGLVGTEDLVRRDASELSGPGVRCGDAEGLPVRHGPPSDPLRPAEVPGSPARASPAARPEVFPPPH